MNELLPAAAGVLAREVECLAAADVSLLLCRAAHLGLPGLPLGQGETFESLDLAMEAADVVAETDGACWCLNRAELDRLEATHPAAALGLLRMLALDLGEKVTLSAQQLTLVEHL
ncbi:MAG: hypothetical protein VKN83_06345 [Cyanobacteriota bacterium]|nr:hypothetical protein [Cyanobacteriota bacterium]